MKPLGVPGAFAEALGVGLALAAAVAAWLAAVDAGAVDPCDAGVVAAPLADGADPDDWFSVAGPPAWLREEL